MKMALGCDHGGYDLKEELLARLAKEGIEAVDHGCFGRQAVDYPDVARTVALAVAGGEADCAVLCCGTGIGMSIAANKVDGIRAALCADVYSARMAREHNNANIIALGGRTLGVELAWEIVRAYLGASFLGGVHETRIKMIQAMEG